MLRIPVKEYPVLIFLQQQLMLVLAVKVDQHIADLTQHPDGDGMVVYESTTAVIT